MSYQIFRTGSRTWKAFSDDGREANITLTANHQSEFNISKGIRKKCGWFCNNDEKFLLTAIYALGTSISYFRIADNKSYHKEAQRLEKVQEEMIAVFDRIYANRLPEEWRRRPKKKPLQIGFRSKLPLHLLPSLK